MMFVLSFLIDAYEETETDAHEVESAVEPAEVEHSDPAVSDALAASYDDTNKLEVTAAATQELENDDDEKPELENTIPQTESWLYI
jgi:hypothetical protein